MSELEAASQPTEAANPNPSPAPVQPLMQRGPTVEETPSINLPGPSQDLQKLDQEAPPVQGTQGEHIKAVLAETSAASPIGVPGYMDTDPGWITRRYQDYQAEKSDRENGTPPLSANEANQKYPGMPVPFSQPISPSLAEVLFKNNQRRVEVQRQKDSSEALPFGVETATGLVAGMTDPLMAGSMFFGAPGIEQGLLKAFTHSVKTNLAINTVLGTASALQEKSEQQNVTALGTAESIVMSSAMGVGVHMGVHTLFNVLPDAYRAVKGIPTDIQERNLKTAAAQHELGAKIDVTSTLPEMTKRMAGDLHDGTRSYTFDPTETPTKYYVGKDSGGRAIEYHMFGEGTQGISDPDTANNMVSNPGGEPGRLGEVDVSGKKLLDIDQPAGTPELKPFETELEDAVGSKLDVQPEESIKDVLSRLGEMAERGDAPHDILSQAQDIAAREGFEGFKHVIGDEQAETQKHAIHLFDTEPEVKELPVNQDITPKPDENAKFADNQKMDSPENKVGYTQELGKQVHDMKHGQPFNSTPEYMDPIVDEQTKAARSMLDKAAETDPALKKELEALDKSTLVEKQKSQLLKDFADCVSA